MTLSELAIAAMRAGLSGRPLPDLGNELSGELLAMVNAVYDEARNWGASASVKSVGQPQ